MCSRLALTLVLTLAFPLSADAEFTTVINLPGDTLPSIISSDTQLNLSDFGHIPGRFDVGAADGSSTNIEVNILGGSVGEIFHVRGDTTVNLVAGTIHKYFRAMSGSTVNITGGVVGNNFGAGGATINISGGSVGSDMQVYGGSTVDISGGTIADDFRAFRGSTVNIYGGEYQLDGVPIVGLDLPDSSLAINLPDGSLLSGTLADETPFAFLSSDPNGPVWNRFTEKFENGTLTLHTSPLPAIGPSVIDGPSDSLPFGLRQGQTMNLSENDRIGDNFNAGQGSTVNISAGVVGNNFEAVGAEITISGGSVGEGFDAFRGSIVNIEGGSVGNSLRAHNGSIVNISGGSIGDYFRADEGSRVSITGGEFRLDGVSIVGLNAPEKALEFNLPGGSFLSGTLADGTPFAFSGADIDTFYRRPDIDRFAEGTLTLRASSLPAVGPTVVDASSDASLLVVREGQTLNIATGFGNIGKTFKAGWGSKVNISSGFVDANAEATGAVVTITGGSVGNNFDVFGGSTVNMTGGSIGSSSNAFVGSTMNISGGSVGWFFEAHSGSVVNIMGGSVGNAFSIRGAFVTISGGTVGSSMSAASGSTVNITGGSIGRGFYTSDGSTVNISGGSIGSGFTAFRRTTLTISGGQIGNRFRVSNGSMVTFFGTEFIMNGAPLSGLSSLGDSLVLTDRGGSVLSVTFRDGSQRDFVLNEDHDVYREGSDYFPAGATLRLTLATPVPEPAGLALVLVGLITLGDCRRRDWR